MESKEYKEFLKKLYESNQFFIDKAVFTFSSAAIPALITFSEKLNLFDNRVYWLYFLSLGLFILVVWLQITACKIAKEGCNLGLDSKNEEANKLFEKADKIDNWLRRLFIIAIIITVVTVGIDVNFKKEKYMKNNKPFEEVQNSLTPPKAIRENTTTNIKKEVKAEPKKGSKND